MKKRASRFIAAFLATAMTTGSLAGFPETGLSSRPPTLTASAADLVYGDLTYTTNENGITITGYTGTDVSVKIPAKIGGKPVTAIGAKAFYANKKLTSVSIPATITVIGAEAFSGCTGLSGFVFHEGLKTIGKSAFRNTGLTEVTIPVSVTSCTGAFIECSKLKKAAFADGTETIPASCLYYAKGLTEVSIPDTVKNIGKDAFNSCTSLKAITLPDGVETIGVEAFRASALTEITLPASLKSCSGSFSSCNTLKKVVFADGTETVPAGCMQNARNLASVTLPSTVKTIGADAFRSCTALTEINLPAKINTIGSSAFENSGLTGITLPISLTSCSEAFKGCQSLKTAQFAFGTVTVPKGCLSGASGLEKVVMPGTVQTIEQNAFSGCKSLREIKLHEGIVAIFAGAFSGSGLREIKFPSTLAKCDSPFTNCGLMKKVAFADGIRTIPAKCLNGSEGVETVSIPSSVKTIGSSAFAGTSSLRSIELPGTLTAIGSSAFEGSGLRSIVIPDSVTNIDNLAFRNCTRLKTVTAGSGVTVLKSSLFSGAVSLEKVTLSKNITEIGYNAFNGCNSLAEIECPVSADSIKTDKTAFRGCFSLTDNRFVYSGALNSDIIADKTVAAAGDIINYTVSFDDTDGFGDSGKNRVVSVSLPEGFTVDTASVKILSGSSTGKTDNSGGILSIPFTSESGSLSFSAVAGGSGIQTVSAELVMTHGGTAGFSEPIGKADTDVTALTINATLAAGLPGFMVNGKGPKGCGVEVYVNGERIHKLYTDINTGSYYFFTSLPNFISNGDKMVFTAKCGDIISDEAVLTYNEAEPVIGRMKLLVDETEGVVDVTEAFTGNYAPVMLLGADGRMRFSLEISNSELISKVYVTAYVNGNLSKLEAVYNAAENCWTAEGSLSDGTYLPEDINFVIVKKSDVSAGKATDFTKGFFSTPGKIVFRQTPSGIVTDGETSEPVSGADISLVGRSSDGSEFVCYYPDYDKKYRVRTNADGGYSLDMPEGEWKIVCSAPGYDAAESDWLIIPGDSAERDFILSRHDENAVTPVTTTAPTAAPAPTVTTAAPAVTNEPAATTAPAASVPAATTTAPVQIAPSDITCDGKFRMGENNWIFNNSARNFKYLDEEVYYLTEEDYDRLTDGLSRAEAYCIENKMSGKWNGSCYGMACLSLLSCYGIFNPLQRDPAALTLTETSTPLTLGILSAINYYHLLQLTDHYSASSTAALYDTPEEVKTRFILDEISAGHPVLLPFNYSFTTSTGAQKTSGHVSLGYEIEDGTYTFENGVYDKKILTYDPNYIWLKDETCLYINSTDGSWVIPKYLSKCADSKLGGRLGYCTADPVFLNYHGLFDNGSMASGAQFRTFLSTLAVDTAMTVHKVELSEDGTWFICPADEQDIEVYAGMDGTEDDGSQDLNYILDDTSKAYRLDLSENDDVDMMLRTEQDLIRLRFDNADEVIVDPEGMVQATGGRSAFTVTMVSNDGCSPTDWHNVEVSGEGAEVSFRRTDAGYILSGDDLTNVTVSAEGNSAKPVCSFSTDHGTVLIHEISEDCIGIATDEDMDGSFEQEIETVPAVRAETAFSNIITDQPRTALPVMPVLLGDTNSDAITDANDASEILGLYAMLSTGSGDVSAETKFISDVNKDGLLDSTDASLILEYYALASTSSSISADEFFRQRRAG